MAGSIRLGTAGWVFEPWRDNFYPKGLPRKQELAHASGLLGSIEINATFYSHQKSASFANWAGQTPPGFTFSVKGHQLVTHLKKLKDVEIPLANFFASGVLALGEKLGPFCWQLPGNLSYGADRIETFLELLPKTPAALATLAAKSDGRLKEPPFTSLDGIKTVRHAIEVRHVSFAVPGFIEQLHRHNVALVVADTAEWPYLDQTADFSYARLQGAPGKERYEISEREQRAGWIAAWAAGRPSVSGPFIGAADPAPRPRDVFAYFVSTDKENAPHNARAVMRQLSLKGPGGT